MSHSIASEKLDIEFQVQLKMSHNLSEDKGTELRDVYNILLHAPSERLQSLTFQLGDTPEDIIIHAFCLVILQREQQALHKLQMLENNYITNQLAEIWVMRGGKLKDFGELRAEAQDLPEETLVSLARMFKVLSANQLCDPLLRNLAYKRALSVDSQKTNTCDEVVYDPFREEARDVCGPQVAVWLSSSSNSQLGHYDQGSSLNEGSTTLLLGSPNPLHGNSIDHSSYPSHLEMSMPQTATYEGDKTTPTAGENSKQSEVTNAPEQSQLHGDSSHESRQPPLCVAKKNLYTDDVTEEQFSSSTTLPSSRTKSSVNAATNSFLSATTASNQTHVSTDSEEDDEARFYSFVILHAPADDEIAESIKNKIETIIGSEGATYSEEFEIPGKNTLRCIEDAINNSAFTVLLLTNNFNNALLEMKTDSALINSINCRHKYNTVIPLLPMQNCLPRQCIPLVLKTLVFLEENRSFERKIKKAFSSARIAQLKSVWTAQQKGRRRSNQCFNKAEPLLENLHIGKDFTGGHSPWQQQPNIHIENANYIMIGNDSQMTVDYHGPKEEDNQDQL